MNPKELYDLIDSLSTDIEFSYAGTHGAICPYARSNIGVCYGDIQKDYSSVSDVMNDKFWGGKSLAEISGQLIFE